MRQRGFTLLEVLIALTVVALAVGALLGTLTSSASNISYLKDKTLAEWVAMNRLTEVRIAKLFPSLGKRTGKAEMGGMRWQWEEEVSELPIKGMFRIDVRARPTGEAVDDSRAADKPTSQRDLEGESSGSATARLTWTTTVTGVISTSRSDRHDAIATRLSGRAGSAGGGPPGSPNNPTPNAPGTPSAPGSPGMPGTPGIPGPGGPGRGPHPPIQPDENR